MPTTCRECDGPVYEDGLCHEHYLAAETPAQTAARERFDRGWEFSTAVAKSIRFADEVPTQVSGSPAPHQPPPPVRRSRT